MPNPIGTVSPTITGWNGVDFPIASTSVLFSFSSLGSFDDIFSWLLVRREWNVGGFLIHEKPQTVNPSNDAVLLFLNPSPQELIASNVGCKIEVLKQYKRLSVEYVEPRWELYCFTLD